MAVDPEFLQYAKELFGGLGPIRTGRMFSGAGLYIDDAMFAMIIGDVIYMKSDAELSVLYRQDGSQPFEYNTKNGTRVIPGMMRLPDSAMDDPDAALEWATRSLVPAIKAANKRKKA